MREKYVKALQDHGISIDIYGKCGPFDCSRKIVSSVKIQQRNIFTFTNVNSVVALAERKGVFTEGFEGPFRCTNLRRVFKSFISCLA